MEITKEEKNKKKIVHFRPLFYGFLAFLVGIVFSPKIFRGDLTIILIASFLFIFLFALCFYKKQFMAFVVCLVLFFLGNGTYFLGMLPLNSQKDYYGEVAITGRASDNISNYEYQTRVLLDNVTINGEHAKNIYVYIKGSDVKVEVGSTLCFETKVNKIQPFELGSFNSAVVRENLAYTCNVEYDKVASVAGSMSFDEGIRLKLKETLLANMSETNAYVAFAVLTGEKSGIDNEIYSYYRDTGILHLLTVSGLHVGIIVSFLVMLFRLCRANKWIAFAVVGIFLILYNYICGFAPSVMRASVMGMVLLLCKNIGKQYDGLSSLGLAGFIILFINPLYAFDVGFLMSMACVMMIYVLFRPINKIFSKFLPRSIASYISLSICAQIGTLPFLASFYSTFNFLSFFVNLLIVPFFSIIFILLFASTILCLIMPFLGFMLSLSDWCLIAITEIAKFYSSTILSVNLKPFSTVVTVLASIGLWTVSDFLMLKIKAKSVYAVLLVSSILISSAISLFPNKNSESEMYYVNKYESTSLLLRSKNGDSFLVGYSSNIESLFDSQNLPPPDYYLSTSYISQSRKNNLDKLKVKTFIMCGYRIDEDKEIQILTNQKTQINSFNITVFEFEEVNLATKIEFDNKSIFFTNVSDLSYNEIEYLTSVMRDNFDYAFIANEEHLSLKINAKNLVSTGLIENASYSYYKNGNLKIYDNLLKVGNID